VLTSEELETGSRRKISAWKAKVSVADAVAAADRGEGRRSVRPHRASDGPPRSPPARPRPGRTAPAPHIMPPTSSDRSPPGACVGEEELAGERGGHGAVLVQPR
jgi:hypothetical protein